ncbi:MAG: Maf family nucleotide pyrophosphatase [Saprospiraceae bacterium]|nr:Maf family nucleotide pyrophosphatase [Saprospiraceae bacterium]
MEWLKKYKIVLASESPRRHELLRQAGISFEIKAASIDEEAYPSWIQPRSVPEYLAKLKAQTVYEMIPNQDDLIVIAADCLVFLGDQLFSKPRHRQEAFTMLYALAGQTHQVISGLCIYSTKSILTTSVSTEVEFNPMTADEIYYYIDHYPPYDKAGAYGIQDWIGLCVVKKLNGSYTNIMGLPMEALYTLLVANFKN